METSELIQLVREIGVIVIALASAWFSYKATQKANMAQANARAVATAILGNEEVEIMKPEEWQ